MTDEEVMDMVVMEDNALTIISFMVIEVLHRHPRVILSAILRPT